MRPVVSDQALSQLFRDARSYNSWSDTPISDVQIQAVYDLLRWGPTSANCSPARFWFVTSEAAKQKLLGCVSAGNSEKVATAPCTVIIAHDMAFYDKIPQLFPHNPGARDWFAHDAKIAESTAFRNCTLQGAYLMLAARSLGLDYGPMSGFDNAKVDEAFFAGTTLKSNFLCALGVGTADKLFPRGPRLSFDEACSIL
jgi:3-hydroxypropanoate dehydrogenase